MRQYFVYIAASPSRTIYTRVTNNLERRMYEHRSKLFTGITAKDGVNRIVHMEEFADINDAITREKEIKGGLRAKKVALIEAENSNWRYLSQGWFD